MCESARKKQAREADGMNDVEEGGQSALCLVYLSIYLSIYSSIWSEHLLSSSVLCCAVLCLGTLLRIYPSYPT